ncbi:MAG: sigW 2 [Acidimicrobiales bacterium]|nr:sigW 2 [Acidimicrobiales bacterium]
MRDVELVEAVRRGEPRAWAHVYDQYGPRLHAFCTRVLNEPHAAADAVQDTFVVASQRFDQLRDPDKLRPWLYAIARNECTRHGRARARVVPVEDTGQMSTPDHLDPGVQAASSDAAALLWSAADGLDGNDRLLLELNIRHGLEGQELAEAAGISPSQVSMATKRMRSRIERSLGALLVARRGRQDCPGLGVVLAGWDGTFTVLMRKRVSRHIDNCDLCENRRALLVAPLGSLAALPFVLPDPKVREQVLAAIASVHDGTAPTLPATHETWPGGFPPVLASEAQRRRLLWVAAVAGFLLVALAGTMWASARSDQREQARAAQRAAAMSAAPGGTRSGGTRSGGTDQVGDGSVEDEAGSPDAGGDQGDGALDLSDDGDLPDGGTDGQFPDGADLLDGGGDLGDPGDGADLTDPADPGEAPDPGGPEQGEPPDADGGKSADGADLPTPPPPPPTAPLPPVTSTTTTSPPPLPTTTTTTIPPPPSTTTTTTTTPPPTTVVPPSTTTTTTTPTTTTTTVPNQAPTVGTTTRSPAGDMQTTCNPAESTRTVSVSVTDDDFVAAVLLHWCHSAGGSGM